MISVFCGRCIKLACFCWWVRMPAQKKDFPFSIKTRSLFLITRSRCEVKFSLLSAFLLFSLITHSLWWRKICRKFNQAANSPVFLALMRTLWSLARLCSCFVIFAARCSREIEQTINTRRRRQIALGALAQWSTVSFAWMLLFKRDVNFQSPIKLQFS